MAICKESFSKLSSHVGMFSHYSNIGVIECDDGLHVIDTGNSNDDGKAIVETLKEIYPGKKILSVILTHAHSDHCGGTNYIKLFTKAKIWSSDIENSVLEFPLTVATMYWGGYPLEELENDPLILREPVHPDVIYEEEEIELPDVKLKFIPLPGHFFNQMGILVTDKEDGKKSFFLGDGFFGMEMLKKFWIPFMLDQEKFRESVDVIENTYADFYIPSHGTVCKVDSIHALAEMNIIATLEFEVLIIKLLEKQPMTQEELLTKIANYAGIKMKIQNYILLGTTMRSYLSSMEKRKMVTKEFLDNQLIWSSNEELD